MRYTRSFGICLFLTFVLFQITCFNGLAKEPDRSPDRSKVAGVMHSFYADLLLLKPYIVSEEEFTNPKNEKTIRKKISKMSTDISQAEKSGLFDDDVYRVSLKAFNQHMKELGVVFDRGNKQYAHWMLNSMTAICASCHMQLPQAGQPQLAESKTFKSLKGKELFQEAEFYFVTRRINFAEEGFRRVIREYPSNKLSGEDLESAIRRNLAIYARIKRDPKLGATRMKEILSNKALPKYIKSNVAAWMGSFNRWAKSGEFDVEKSTSSEILKFANGQLKTDLWDKMIEAGDPRVVTYLRVSGALYQYLHMHPKDKRTAEILLLLARCEQQLNNEFFFSLADLYLRECIVSHSGSPAAKQCYKEYEESVVASYSGSSGTHMPKDVRQSLVRLKKLVSDKSGQK